jgi:ABC-type iron transport system FetAB ATPase subunit
MVRFLQGSLNVLIRAKGVPTYRTRVLYLPQRPSLLPGTPRDFLNVIWSFGSRRKSAKTKSDERFSAINMERPVEIAKAWGVDEELWDRDWSNLSGGEAQRVAMAVAVGLDAAEVLLLDGTC